jgi:hypothetical protein
VIGIVLERLVLRQIAGNEQGQVLVARRLLHHR